MILDWQRIVRVQLKRLCRPLARFCVRYSLTFQDISETLKKAFVEAAEESLIRDQQTVNVSRLALVAGLQRKEITRLQNLPPQPDTGASLLSRIVGQWQQHPDYSTFGGIARALSFEGAESEFATLVRSVSKDLNPYTVLFELERIGLVERRESLLALRSGTYQIKGEDRAEEAFELLERDSDDLLSAVGCNILESPPIPHLHLRTEYDNVCREALPEIREWLLDRGTTFHEEARSYLAKFDKDVNPRLYQKEGGARVMLGAFSFTEIAKGKSDE